MNEVKFVIVDRENETTECLENLDLRKLSRIGFGEKQIEHLVANGWAASSCERFTIEYIG